MQVMKECKVDQFLVKYQEDMKEDEIKASIRESLIKCLNSDEWNPDLKALDKYSAKESARKLVNAMEYILKDPEINSA